ncbi:MAG: YbjN domain-containing protein [Chloroflexi bacterium]|nr:YbjN domain-containing protein [Chloroflexota bacterium]
MLNSARTPEYDPSLDAVAARVDNVLRALGVDPGLARLPGTDAYNIVWQFQRGSAFIEVRLVNEGGRRYFQVCAPIMHLPSDNLVRLYRRLLEYNMQLSGAAFAVYRDVVYVVNERMLEGLDDAEANVMISNVAGFADTLDDKLVREFGGRLYGQV